jgi:hypothetical protein
MQQIHDVVCAGIFVDETDQKRATARETACREARVIVQLLDDFEHARARFLAYVRFVVQHARDSLDRHARSFGDVVDLGSAIRRLRHAGCSALSSRCSA